MRVWVWVYVRVSVWGKSSREGRKKVISCTNTLYTHTHIHTLLQGIKHFEVHALGATHPKAHPFAVTKETSCSDWRGCGRNNIRPSLGFWAGMHAHYPHACGTCLVHPQKVNLAEPTLFEYCKSPPGLSKLSQSLHGLQWTRTKILLLLFNIIMMSLGPRWEQGVQFSSSY